MNQSRKQIENRGKKPGGIPVRMAVDLAMAVLLSMLMAYALIGETFHEAAGDRQGAGRGTAQREISDG